jgi:hypothetical protein
MKRIVLSFFAIALFAFVSTAQPCTPDAALTTPGFSPDSVTNLPVGQATVYYEAVISALIPTDTVYMGVTAVIDSIGVVNVIGLPAGLSWTTDSPNNFWDGGQKGCLIIQGTTTLHGVHNIQIALTARGNLGGMPIVVPDTVKFYRIDMQPASVNEFSGESFAVGQAFPNPAYDITNIEVTVGKPSMVSFSLYNLVGVQMIDSKHQLQPGQNTISVNVKQFPSGMYFYKVTNGETTITRKLNITK